MGSAAGLASRVPAAQQSSGHIPATTMLVFDSLSNPVAVGDRIRSLSASLAAPDTTSLLLTAEEAAPNGLLDRLLSRCAASTAGWLRAARASSIPNLNSSITSCLDSNL